MTPALRSQMVATIRKLMALPSLEPQVVADILQRRLQLDDETDARRIYLLIGGPPIPFVHVSLYWANRPAKGGVTLALGEECRPPMPEMTAEFGDDLVDYSVLPRDPKRTTGHHAFAYRASAGEMRILFRDYKENFKAESFIVTQFPALAWDQAPTSLPFPIRPDHTRRP